jgi:uncharacterized membrane protein
LKSSLLIVLALVAAFVGFNFVTVVNLKSKISDTTSQLDSALYRVQELERSYELAEGMHYLQIYMNKLWFAGIEENEELTNFYLHELEEFMEDIVSRNVVSRGKNVSELMQSMALPQIELLENQLEKKDKIAFVLGYRGLMNSCNSCHIAAGRPYLVIDLPKSPVLDNQVFSKSDGGF